MSKNKRRKIFKYYKKLLISRATPAEKKFMCLLQSHNIRFKFQKIFVFKRRHCIVDFCLMDYKLCVEIDGGYHILTKKQDFSRDCALAAIGFKTLRFTNREIFEEPDFVIKVLSKFIIASIQKEESKSASNSERAGVF